MKEKLTIEETRKAFRSATEKARRSATKKARKARPGATREVICERCGKKLIVPSLGTARMKYCYDCAKIVKYEKSRESVEAYKSAQTKEKKKRRESQIYAIAKSARAAGMSYGRYVAMKGAGRI